jgi:hypothetical protein
MKLFMYVEVRPHVGVVIQYIWKMLTLVVGLCCVGFITPIGVVTGDRRRKQALSV